MSGSNCTDLDHCECVDALYQRIAELETSLLISKKKHELAIERIAELEAQCESLQNKCATRGLSPEDSDALEAENERLRDALTEITELYYPAEIHRKALKYIKNEGGRMGCLESGDDCQRVAEKALSDAKLQEKGDE